MVRNALAFVGGLLVVHQLPALPPAVPGVLVLGLFALLGLLLQSRIFLLVCCGFAWAWLNAAVRLAADLPPPLEGADLAITGCVATLPERATGSVRFGMDVDRTDERIPRFVELSWYEPQIELAPGDCLDATVRLRGRRGFANPGGFDYEAQLLARGVGATGYVRELERTEGPARPWRYSLAIARSWLSERLDRAVGERPAIGIIKGLAIGDRQALTDTQWRTLSATGTSHLMAISGLHIGIVAGLAAWFGRAFARWPGAQRRRLTGQDAAAASAMLAATVYAALAGFAIPTQRALAMLAVYLLARTLRRNGGASAILAWSAVVVVLIDPFAPLSAGAWLSFGAVAAILWGMAGRPVRSGRYTDFLRVQGAVTLCLVPFLVSGFGQVSLVSPIANLLAIPAFSLLIVPLVLLGTLLMAVSLTAGAAVLALAATAVEFAWPVLEALADWPLATLHVAMPTAPALLLLGCLTWLAIAPLPWPARFLAIVGSALLLARTPPAPPATEVEVAVLDVGQGLAVVVRTERHALVYDTGPAFRSGRDTGELVVLPYLRSQGIRRVDRLVATHGDLDHVGGLDSVIAGIEVLRVIAGPSVGLSRRQVIPCVRGERWHWDGVDFSFLHPPQSAGASAMHRSHDNDTSCVLEIRTGAHRVLLTGDIEAATEAELERAGLLAPATLVVAPHHGSRTSSTAAFVAATRPDLVVFAAGYRNRWGFPKPDVEQRWRDVGAATLGTAESGAITLRLGPDGPRSLDAFRLSDRRYWRR